MIEAGSTRGSRWLRERRLKVAVALALVEGALVVFDVIPATLALLVAAAVLVAYFGWARRRRSATLREGFWGPGGLAGARRARAARGAAWTLALVAIAVVAAIALVALLADRRN